VFITSRDLRDLGLGENTCPVVFLSRISQELGVLQESVPWESIEPDSVCDEIFVDVRLRIFEGDWEILWGDVDSDTDHRGSWGYGSLSLSSDTGRLAQDLLEDLVEKEIEELEAMSNPTSYYGCEPR
jgi:hypothetical protein